MPSSKKKKKTKSKLSVSASVDCLPQKSLQYDSTNNDGNEGVVATSVDCTGGRLSSQECSNESTLDDELAWCVAQLELGLLKDSASKSQKDKNSKTIATLQSTKSQLPRKRQLMRNLFGDYRTKMKSQPLSVLLKEKSRLEGRSKCLKAVEPKVLETVGTFYRTKTVESDQTMNNQMCASDFKFDFAVSP